MKRRHSETLMSDLNWHQLRVKNTETLFNLNVYNRGGSCDTKRSHQTDTTATDWIISSLRGKQLFIYRLWRPVKTRLPQKFFLLSSKTLFFLWPWWETFWSRGKTWGRTGIKEGLNFSCGIMQQWMLKHQLCRCKELWDRIIAFLSNKGRSDIRRETPKRLSSTCRESEQVLSWLTGRNLPEQRGCWTAAPLHVPTLFHFLLTSDPRRRRPSEHEPTHCRLKKKNLLRNK